MKIRGSIYRSKNGKTYLAFYNHHPDIYFKAPPSIRKNSKRVAHFTYGFGGHVRGIDIFLLIDSNLLRYNHLNLSREMNIKRIIRENNKDFAYVDRKQNIVREIIQGHDDKSLLNMVRKDIKDFVRSPAKNPGQNKIIYVNKIIPKTKLEKIKLKKREKYTDGGGKQIFVPLCLQKRTLEHSWGCPSSFVPGKKASFNGEYFINFFLDPFVDCSYCYASRKHKTYPKHVWDIDKKRLVEELRGLEILRLGKLVDCGSRFMRDSLITTLEAAIETETKVVMPNKHLEFDRDVVKLFKRTKSSLLYSIGWDELEEGACAHGCTNEWRLEQAVQYRKAGVNSIIYLLADLVHDPTKRELDVFKFAKKNKIPVQLLSIRIPKKELAKKITGYSWDSLKGPLQIDMFGNLIGGYSHKAGELIAQEIHPFYKNMDICHHDDKLTYCGGCGIRKRIVRPTEHIRVDYSKKREIMEEKRRRKRKKEKNLLFEHI